MQEVFFQGAWRGKEEIQLSSTNRSFRYGDGLFESFRWASGKWLFQEYHWQRFTGGAKLLKLRLHTTAKDEILAALHQLPKSKVFHCRLTVWRSGEGKYTPEQHGIEWMIQISTSQNIEYQFSALAGLSIDMADTLLSPHSFSEFKTNAALPYVLASIEKQDKGLDDVLLCNIFGELVESSNSNIFLVMSNKILTPPLRSGCLNGTIRQVLLSEFNKNAHIQEQTLFPSDLKGAKEIWLTNSSNGIRWVKQCGKLTFGYEIAATFQQKLNALAFG